MKVRFLLLVGILAVRGALGDTGPIEITLKHGSPGEAQVKEQLQRLLQRYPLQRWYFTRSIVIDETAIPHSHPILTLHTRHYLDDDLLLSSFVHEELHWFLEAHPKETEEAQADLKNLFPKMPVGFPDGADTEESGYLHLLVNMLEWQSDRQLLGELRARQIMEFWTHDHYRWIYQTVLDHADEIRAVLAKHGLKLPAKADEKS